MSFFKSSLMPNEGESGVYSFINRNNLKAYVGSSQNIRSRFREHKHNLLHKEHHSRYFQRAFDKDPDAFEFSVIEIVKDFSRLIEREQFWMNFFGSYNPHLGYNISPTAKSCRGVKRTDEERATMSRRLKGRKLSPQARLNVIAAIKRRKRNPWTAEQRIRVGKSRRLLGLKREPEVTKRWLEKRKQIKWGYSPVIQMDLDGREIMRHDSITEAVRFNGFKNKGNIHVVCKGKRHTAFGFKWKYAE